MPGMSSVISNFEQGIATVRPCEESATSKGFIMLKSAAIYIEPISGITEAGGDGRSNGRTVATPCAHNVLGVPAQATSEAEPDLAPLRCGTMCALAMQPHGTPRCDASCAPHQGMRLSYAEGNLDATELLSTSIFHVTLGNGLFRRLGSEP
jgi:hypothetical protein